MVDGQCQWREWGVGGGASCNCEPLLPLSRRERIPRFPWTSGLGGALPGRSKLNAALALPTNPDFFFQSKKKTSIVPLQPCRNQQQP
jgi:hypothetical protein